MAGKLDDRRVIPTDHGTTRGQPSEAIPRSRQTREETMALVAESQQAQRQAGRLREQSSILLDTAAAITASVLAQRRIGLAHPVDTKFHTNGNGSTGIKVIVRLQDPTRAAAARKAIVERFGGLGSPDSLEIR